MEWTWNRKVPSIYYLIPLPNLIQAPYKVVCKQPRGTSYVQESAHLILANISCLSHHKNNIQWQLYEKIFFRL